MSNKIVLRNGCIINPETNSETIADVFIADGTIVAFDNAPTDFQAAEEIDCHDCLIAPGFIDLSATVQGSLHSELFAAVKGGFTRMCVSPDSDPLLDTQSAVESLTSQAQRAAKAEVLAIGALTQGLAGKQLAEMAVLKEAGCVAVGQAYHPIFNTKLLYRALQYAANTNLLVIHCPVDPWWQDKSYVHAGKENLTLGLAAMPVCAEVSEIAKIIALLPETGARVHFSRLSSARAVELIADAKARGLAVSADVALHHLWFTETMHRHFEGYAIQPPLRSEADRAALRNGVMDGTIDAVCSAHTPYEADALLVPFSETPPGLSALELVWPVLVKLHRELNLSWCQCLNLVTAAPARILGLSQGALSVGKSAELTILSPTAEWDVSADTLVSRGKNTPFLGHKVQGLVLATYVHGRRVYSR
jgi:dihydroorotase